MEFFIKNILIYLVILLVLGKFLGGYIAKVFEGKKVFLTRFVSPIEKVIYKFLRIDENKEMNWKEYSFGVVAFSLVGFIFIFLLQLLQKFLPFNPQNLKGVSWDLSFNTAASFITNTNWQAYSGESTLSYLTQALGLTVQNFLSAAVGIVVVIALIRAFVRKSGTTLGNLWRDIVKTVLYILIPLSIVVSVALISQGVVQNLKPYTEVNLVEQIELEDGTIIDKQVIPGGMAASQIAIKQIGTNGGGFFGTNSAYPLENPTTLSNLIQVLSILLIPMALCFTFGNMVNNKKQGRALLIAMTTIFVVALAAVLFYENSGTAVLSQNGAVSIATSSTQVGGNMEGKEMRFGIFDSSFWAVSTTAASNGSVNSMHDSYTPMAGMVTMVLMQLGEVVFGGVGSGLYGMLAFAIMAVFIAGLMVGRTPEYLGKKIEPFEMKMASLTILTPGLLTLIGAAILCLWPGVMDLLNNSGAHGFSEVIYAMSSVANNNGSAFAGFGANNIVVNLVTGFAMLLGRFIPMILTLAIAGSLVSKKKLANTSGTLDTSSVTFIVLLIIVILIIGALSFLPVLGLGPIAEYLQSIL